MTNLRLVDGKFGIGSDLYSIFHSAVFAQGQICRLNLAEGAIKNDIPAANIGPLILDLSSLSSVRKAAAGINAIEGPLHVH
jgi:hypothetical protein